MNYFEPSLSPSTSSSLEVTSKRKSGRRSKAKFHRSEDYDSEPSGSGTPIARKRRIKSRRKIATPSDSSSDSSDSDIAPPEKQRSKRRERIRLEDSSDGESEAPVSDVIHARKDPLRHLIDRLIRENDEDSKPFTKPVDAIAEDVPTYHRVIKRPMDLYTLKENLGKGLFSAVKDFEADFNLIIENSIRFSGLMHEVSQRGLRLLHAFNALMASLPGCAVRSSPRKASVFSKPPPQHHHHQQTRLGGVEQGLLHLVYPS